MSTDRDHKIEKINSYRKLLEVTLKAVSKNDMVQAEVQIEFIEFINDQLNNLMGEDNPNGVDKLTSDEIFVLKALVANATKKAPIEKSNLSNPVNKNSGTTLKKEEPKQGYVPRNVQPPLGNRDIDKKSGGNSRQASDPNRDILNQLDAMDKKFENEF